MSKPTRPPEPDGVKPFDPPPPGGARARRFAMGWPGAVRREIGRMPYLYSFIIVAHVSALMMAFERDWILRLRFSIDREWREFFNAVGHLGKPEQYIAVCLAAIAIHRAAGKFGLWPHLHGRLRRFARAGVYVAASILAGGVVLNLAKFVIGRWRPRALFADGAYGFEMFNTDFGMNSFPSGHSQMAFSLAAALCFVYPRFAWAYLSLAAFIALSRLGATVHFPADVLMGSYIGVCSALLIKKHVFDKRGVEVRVRFRDNSRNGG